MDSRRTLRVDARSVDEVDDVTVPGREGRLPLEVEGGSRSLNVRVLLWRNFFFAPLCRRLPLYPLPPLLPLLPLLSERGNRSTPSDSPWDSSPLDVEVPGEVHVDSSGASSGNGTLGIR
jgi:hypothetical protein